MAKTKRSGRRGVPASRHEMRVANKVVERIEAFEHQFRNRMTALMISALGLVAALAWNESIKEVISLFVLPGQAVVYKTLVAVVVSVFAVVIIIVLTKKPSRGRQEQVELP